MGKLLKNQFRQDASIPWPAAEGQYVTPEEAYAILAGQTDSEVARLRMLARMGLNKEDVSAADARARMIERGKRRGL